MIGATGVTVTAGVTEPSKILLLHEDPLVLGSVASRLEQEGFEVTCARSFLEAAPFLVAGRLDLLLISLPKIEWIRNAILAEVRRANPALPIVAMTPTVSEDLEQVLEPFEVASVRPADEQSWRGTVDAIRDALDGSKRTARRA